MVFHPIILNRIVKKCMIYTLKALKSSIFPTRGNVKVIYLSIR